MNQRFRSSGKLLLSAEYAILDGALGLAVPTSKGQSLLVSESMSSGLKWLSRDFDGSSWFSAEIALSELDDTRAIKSGDPVRDRLLLLLREARKLNADFLGDTEGYSVETLLEFPRDWGLGTSSTLINNLAQWSGTDAYTLQQRTFGGSGYDIACASRTGPIFYQKVDGVPVVTEADFFPPFASSLFFIHLNRKQDSGNALAHYRKNSKPDAALLEDISQITRDLASARELSTFVKCMEIHEKLMSSLLGQPTIKDLHFRDYGGCIKSLGAWGGDFILVSGTAQEMVYFAGKGYTTIIPYPAMVV